MSKLKRTVRARIAETGETHEEALRQIQAQGRGDAPPQEAPVVTTPDWVPLGRDGVWLEERLWERNLGMLRSRDDGRRALAALSEVFTPEWSRRQHDIYAEWVRLVTEEPDRPDKAEEIRRQVHPILRDAITIGGRYRLLEAGLMLAAMPDEKKWIRGRIHPAHQYDATCAELRAGLLLQSTGAQVTWEPVKKGSSTQKASGPDWKASWATGALGVEVKRPRVRERAAIVRDIEMTFFSEFSGACNSPPLTVDSGIWLTVHPSAEILRLKTPLGFPDKDAIRALARDAAENVRRRMPSPTVEGRFAAGRGGDFSIGMGKAGDPDVQFVLRALPGDESRDAKDAYDLVRKAAGQLLGMDEGPGLVLLDADDDPYLVNHLAAIRETLLTEEWASNLAGVAVITKTTSVPEGATEARIDTIMHILPGVRVSALERTLLAGLRLCDRGHFHADPLLVPARRCELTW